MLNKTEFKIKSKYPSYSEIFKNLKYPESF